MLRIIRYACAGLLLSLASSPPAVLAADHWVGTWATSQVTAKNPGGVFGIAAMDKTVSGADGTTLREMVHVSIGGSSVRIVLSNEFGVDPLTIGAASIAKRASGSGITGNSTPLLFGGQASVVIPAGMKAVSDAASLTVAPLSDVAVSLFLPSQPVSQLTLHGFADATNYLAAGNVVSAATLDGAREIASWDFLKGVDVVASDSAAGIVTLGDSITDGSKSSKDANLRWPDLLAARLQANPKTTSLGIMNEGIGGNRILHDVTGPAAIARFERDVLGNSGAKYLVILLGINDIGHAADPVKPYDVVSADELIAGYKYMAARAHAHGMKVYGATLTPYVGAKYQSPQGETMRQALNGWIRSTKELDGVIDFDKAARDPAKPDTFLPAYDSGDHLHPNDAGMKGMADAIDLKLFEK